jgi:hypothetical protein
VHLLWESLSADERQLVAEPELRLEGDVSWPVTSPQLAALVKVKDSQIRDWANKEKLPHWRRGRDRCFPQAAAIVAFALRKLDQLDQSYASRLVGPDGLEHLAVSVGIATVERAARTDDPVEALDELARELSRLADGVAEAGRRRREGTAVGVVAL